jgi:hypothetical protein
MPAHLMDDNKHAELNAGANLFTDYATVADSLGVYTTSDYAAIVDHLVTRWDVAGLRVGGARPAACLPCGALVCVHPQARLPAALVCRLAGRRLGGWGRAGWGGHPRPRTPRHHPSPGRLPCNAQRTATAHGPRHDHSPLPPRPHAPTPRIHTGSPHPPTRPSPGPAAHR